MASPSTPRCLSLDKFLDIFNEITRICSSCQHSTRVSRFRQEKKEEEKKHTLRTNKSQLMCATLCLLRIIFLRKDIALQIGQVDDVRTIAGKPSGREDLMSDEGGPDWFSVTVN